MWSRTKTGLFRPSSQSWHIKLWPREVGKKVDSVRSGGHEFNRAASSLYISVTPRAFRPEEPASSNLSVVLGFAMQNNVELLASYWTICCGVPHTDHEYSPFDFRERVESAARAGFKGFGIWHAD